MVRNTRWKMRFEKQLVGRRDKRVSIRPTAKVHELQGLRGPVLPGKRQCQTLRETRFRSPSIAAVQPYHTGITEIGEHAADGCGREDQTLKWLQCTSTVARLTCGPVPRVTAYLIA